MIYKAIVATLEDLQEKPYKRGELREVTITDDNADICGQVRYEDGKFIVDYEMGITRAFTEIKAAATEIDLYIRGAYDVPMDDEVE